MISKRRKSKLRTILVVNALLFMLAGCGQGQNNVISNSIEKNNISGILNLYTSEPTEDADKVKRAFEQKYPKVHVNIFRSGTEQVVSKIMVEDEAGKVQADVILLADAPTFEILKDKGMLLSYHSSETSKIPEQFIDNNYDFVGTKAITTGILYNTNLIHNAPTDWSDLLSSQAKGKVTMPSPDYSGAAAYNLGVMTRTNGLGWNFFKQLHSNGVVVAKGNGTIITQVAQGQMDYGIVIDYMGIAAKQKGSPVDFIYPKSGCPVITEPVGILKDTQNKAAAEAFEDFVLSGQGQQLWTTMGYVPLRTDVTAPNGLKSINDFTVLSVDTKILANSRDTDKKEFGAIMR